MSIRVTRFEDTPNPNAVKCWLDRPISAGIRSFLSAEQAAGDPVAAALFSEAGATTVLFAGEWMTVNKSPETDWPAVKAAVRRILRDAGHGAESGADA